MRGVCVCYLGTFEEQTIEDANNSCGRESVEVQTHEPLRKREREERSRTENAETECVIQEEMQEGGSKVEGD